MSNKIWIMDGREFANGDCVICYVTDRRTYIGYGKVNDMIGDGEESWIHGYVPVYYRYKNNGLTNLGWFLPRELASIRENFAYPPPSEVLTGW